MPNELILSEKNKRFLIFSFKYNNLDILLIYGYFTVTNAQNLHILTENYKI